MHRLAQRAFVISTAVLGLLAVLAPGIASSRSVVQTSPPKDAMQAPYAIGLDGPHRLIVVNNRGMFLTTDNARSQGNITPKTLDGYYEHVDQVQAIGSTILVQVEGDSRYDFVLSSSNSGRSWQIKQFPGAVARLALTARNKADVEIETANGRDRYYQTANAGKTWASSTAADLAVPSDVSGQPLPDTGQTPDHLRVLHAIRYPHGTAWAQSHLSIPGSGASIYLLKSSDGGTTWHIATSR